MANEIVIRNKTGQRLGTIVEEGNRFVARDLTNLPLGYYTPNDDYTRDKTQQIICKGNMLPMLVMMSARS
jgi:hypothetical protein